MTDDVYIRATILSQMLDKSIIAMNIKYCNILS
jgi:hypothetical protein